MIYNYIFNKKITKSENGYYLELTIPYNYNNFFYKIYGSDGFYNYGRYSSFINTTKTNYSENNINYNINNK